MDRKLFERPVTILVGLGFPAEIKSVTEAYSLLVDWPEATRNEAHRVALNACRAALTGDIDSETARGLFAAFANRSNILIEPLAVSEVVGTQTRASLSR